MAAGIFLAKKLILPDGIAQRLLILKDAAFFGEQIGHCRNRGVSLTRSRIAVIDGAVRLHHMLILAARALVFGPAFESLAHALGFFKRRMCRDRVLRSRRELHITEREEA